MSFQLPSVPELSPSLKSFLDSSTKILAEFYLFAFKVSLRNVYD